MKELTESGDLAPAWRDAFLAVPRERFVPDTVWTQDGDRMLPLRRDDDEAAWLRLCHANAFVITQVDAGNPAGPGRPAGTSPAPPAARTSWRGCWPSWTPSPACAYWRSAPVSG